MTEGPIVLYELRKKGNNVLLGFLAIGLLGWVVMVYVLGYGLLTKAHRLKDLGSVLFILILAGLFIMRIWLWHLRGVEILSAYADRIEFSKRGSFGYFVRRVSINEVDRIYAHEDVSTPQWIKWWGFAGGTLAIKYLGRTILIGQDLSAARATEIASELKALYADRYPL